MKASEFSAFAAVILREFRTSSHRSKWPRCSISSSGVKAMATTDLQIVKLWLNLWGMLHQSECQDLYIATICTSALFEVLSNKAVKKQFLSVKAFSYIPIVQSDTSRCLTVLCFNECVSRQRQAQWLGIHERELKLILSHSLKHIYEYNQLDCTLSWL